jgi:hypothetical protein
MMAITMLCTVVSTIFSKSMRSEVIPRRYLYVATLYRDLGHLSMKKMDTEHLLAGTLVLSRHYVVLSQ